MALFNQLIGDNNPFDGIDVGRDADPVFADIDGDGDLDAFIGEQDGTLNFFENTGNATNPSFTERTGTDNPFNLNIAQPFNINFVNRLGDDSDPALIDLDGDGDLDAIVGLDDGTLRFFENTGNVNNPVFGFPNNLFGQIDIGLEASPTLGDMDGDGDLDLIIGNNNGTLSFFENTGNVNDPVFTEQTGTDNPFNGVDVGSDSDPTLIDIDNDGDLDLIVGEQSGNLNFFKNTGDANTPRFTQQFGVNNPFNGVDVGTDSQPTVADIDGDGNLDLIVGEDDGTINFFLNADDPFDGFDVGTKSAPTLVDIDNDGDLDAFVGAKDGTINFFENTGNVSNPKFSERRGSTNPLNGIDVGSNSAPTFVDIDGDGDLDAFVGAYDGTLNFFENTGNATEPIFIEQTGTDNPLNGIDVGGDSIPTFVDIDGDGDLDAFVGKDVGTINFFENTGNLNNPVFTEQTGSDNPFDGVDAVFFSAPTFTDTDGDGDLDAIVGQNNGTIHLFENTGDLNNPVFTEKTGLENPFNGLDVGFNSTPSLKDIDNDGDLDIFVGESDGTINFFENTGPLETELNLVETSLTITDIDGGISPDTLTLTEIGTTLLIEDPNQAFQVNNDIPSPNIPGEIEKRIAVPVTISERNGITLNSFNSAEVALDLLTEPIAINTLAGDDSITTNTTLAVTVNAGAGDDTVIGGQGADSIRGGQGEDLIEGGGENDLLLGFGSDDALNGGSGDDSLNGGGGNDLLEGSSGNDTLSGGNGRDTLSGESGDDTLLGGGGSDSLLGGSGNDLISGVAGFDVLDGGNGEDTLNGGQGNDTLNGGQGNDALQGGAQNDLLLGASGNDTLNGGSGSDSLNGGSGNDLLSGSTGRDTLNGGSGDDRLFGGDAQDTLLGSVGDDTLDGGDGADRLIGGAGNDLLVGGAGPDLLNGTDNIRLGVNERDTLIGGLGSEDQFQLGDSNGAFYLDEGIGTTSFARIQNFESIDKIILTGSRDDYRIVTNGTTTSILRVEPGADDTIAIIENTVGLNLNSEQFSFV